MTCFLLQFKSTGISTFSQLFCDKLNRNIILLLLHFFHCVYVARHVTGDFYEWNLLFFLGGLWERHPKEKVHLQIVWKNLGVDLMILSVFQLEVIDFASNSVILLICWIMSVSAVILTYLILIILSDTRPRYIQIHKFTSRACLL